MTKLQRSAEKVLTGLLFDAVAGEDPVSVDTAQLKLKATKLDPSKPGNFSLRAGKKTEEGAKEGEFAAPANLLSNVNLKPPSAVDSVPKLLDLQVRSYEDNPFDWTVKAQSKLISKVSSFSVMQVRTMLLLVLLLLLLLSLLPLLLMLLLLLLLHALIPCVQGEEELSVENLADPIIIRVPRTDVAQASNNLTNGTNVTQPRTSFFNVSNITGSERAYILGLMDVEFGKLKKEQLVPSPAPSPRGNYSSNGTAPAPAPAPAPGKPTPSPSPSGESRLLFCTPYLRLCVSASLSLRR